MKMNIVDLLAALPDRSTTEKLVSDYFDSQEPSLSIEPSSVCDEFWQAPTKVSPAWLAILYGIISCAQWIDHIINVDSPVTKPDGFKPFDLFDLYRKQCALCLANSNYTHPGKYKVEALGLYLGLEYLHSNNLKTSVSVLLAIAIRLATLMGYHRDAKPYSQVTVFDAEMRRRVWLFLQVTDSVVAWQTGVPRIISQKIGDTAFPTNLLDDDFGPTDTKLPPPRPNTHLTSGVIYLIAREHIMSASSDITDKMSMKTLSHEETTHLNQQLEQARDKVPPFLRITNPNTNQDLNLHRYTLEITFQRTRCILHRQYLVTHRNEQKYKPLHQICVDSARQILHHQSNLFQGIVHQARLYSRTCFSASLSISDCLTAAMVICFEIICLSREHPADSSRADLIRLLQNSCETWRCFPKASFETSKAAETIASMLALVHLDDSHGAVEFPVSVQRGGAELRSPVSMTGDTGTGAFLNVLNGDSTLEMFDWVRPGCVLKWHLKSKI
ncbi:unnamed protein product [Penicillium salamii]|uniref:Xylanolytic transcriptional activator regulatory domain-containing protein n=1 Tax=Penicillium salamii TaxID=1612424 RepID=A0A9W4NL90_9EURO|nr:unnamed protein product [Penicillium salamii]CAG8128960.1 unnamed protein product [Penicillium salamii]CAG8219385.1 unnamed protein product [Penicillium salamii]CAG8269745.1 unnamed protein product [Penicillium salamii]CAG8323735.1 unnamed protein product [Penicillium salamii]